MKASFFGNSLMFILSYYLVFVYVIFGIDKLNSETIFWNIPYSVFIFVISLIIITLLSLWLFKWRSLPEDTFHIELKENTSGETLNYILTILLTIISISTFSWNLLVLLLLIFLIYVSGGIYYLQPLLMIFGFKVYKCKVENNNSVMIITREHIVQGKKYTLKELFDSTYILGGSDK